jgi:hypothetical protein
LHKLGRDYGPEVEIVAGLVPGDALVLNPPRLFTPMLFTGDALVTTG